MKKTLILLCSLFLDLGAFAQDNVDPVYYVVDGINYQIDSSTKTAAVTTYYKSGRKYVSYTGTSANVPSTINYENETYTVILGEDAFYDAAALETVTLPPTITIIPKSCFNGAGSLNSISLPSGLQEIQGGAFSGCTALTSISLPQGLKKIGEASDYFRGMCGPGAFANSGLKSITIPSSVTVLGDAAFCGCKSLEDVSMSSGIKDIGYGCFESCSSLKQLALPSTVETIGRGAFGYSAISSISLPESVTLIGNRSFERCPLTEIKLPASLKVIRASLLSQTSITTLEIPAGVERINPQGLQGMVTAKELTIADGETTLEFDLKADNLSGRDPWKDGAQETNAEGRWFYGTQKYIETLYIGRNMAVWIPEGYVPAATSRAGEGIDSPFAGFQALKDITIGSSVTTVPDLVFADYPELKTLTILTETPLQFPPMTAEQAESVIVTVPESCVETYRNLEGWSGVKHINGQSAIDIITADEQNAPVEYFNLRGEKISNPSNGIFIKRQGSEVTKVRL